MSDILKRIQDFNITLDSPGPLTFYPSAIEQIRTLLFDVTNEILGSSTPPGYIKIPTNADEATAMALLGGKLVTS